MTFNRETWMQELAQRLQGLREKATGWGVNSVYSLTLAATLWPALDALKAGDFSAMMAVGAAVGTNLIANHLEALRQKPEEEQPAYLQTLLENDAALRADSQKLLEELGALGIALENMPETDQPWYEEQLNAELGAWNRAIKIEGNLEKGIANTGDNNVFNVTFVDKQEIINHYFSGPDPIDVEERMEEAARRDYLNQLINECQNLTLAPLNVDDQTVAAQMKLDDVYIELNTTTPKEDPKKEREKSEPSFGREQEDRLTAIEAVQQSQMVVLLGHPGSGKSTFAKRLLGTLAHAELNGGQLPERFQPGLLPVMVILRDLVPALGQLNLPSNEEKRRRRLADLVIDQAVLDADQIFKTPAYQEGLRNALYSGDCMLVLDGLDEVPQAMRGLIRETVGALISCYDLQRILVTCRIRSYQGEAVLGAFTEHTLAPLTRDQIRKFSRDWYFKQSEMGQVKKTEYEDKAADLTDVATQDEKLLELAENPMLLTSMAIVHQRDTKLPPERVKLFKEVVRILLFRWQAHKVAEEYGELEVFFKDENLILRAMEQLAFEAHRAGKGDKEAADLPRMRALEILQEDHYLGSMGMAEKFMDYVDQRSGILTGRGGALGKPLTYAFPHRFFQEYLAGCHLASEEDPFRLVERFAEIAAEGDFWDVAAVMAFEEFKHNRPSSILKWLGYELRQHYQPGNPQSERLTVWSGQIAVLVGLKAFQDGDQRGRDYLEQLKPELLAVAQGPTLIPLERSEAADALDGLGYLPDDLFGFVQIPASKGRDAFWISKYPVTNHHYQRFLAPENFSQKELWCDFPKYDHEGKLIGDWGDEGWKWLQKEMGKDQPVLYPRYWDSPRFGAARKGVPVVGVSWYEVNAYCKWLLREWNTIEEGQTHGSLNPAGIRLPREAEWEAAAGGIEANRYPWDGKNQSSYGDKDNILERANTDESGIEKTTPVWMYPSGCSRESGLFDLAGNVWEWQANLYREDRDWLALRGGSFYYGQFSARCAYRYADPPGLRFYFSGFRVVVVASPHSS